MRESGLFELASKGIKNLISRRAYSILWVKQFNLTLEVSRNEKTFVIGIYTLGLGIASIAAITYFDKWGATWNYGLYTGSIWIGGAVLAVLVMGVLHYFGVLAWEQSVEPWIVMSCVVAVLISMAGGIFFTEPDYASKRPDFSAYNPQMTRSGGSYIYMMDFARPVMYGIFNVSSSSSSSSSSDDNALTKLGGIAVVGIAILLTVGSFLIPHFWAVSILLIVGMLIQLFLSQYRHDMNEKWA